MTIDKAPRPIVVFRCEILKIEIYWSRKAFFDDRCAALESPTYVMLYLAFYKQTE